MNVFAKISNCFSRFFDTPNYATIFVLVVLFKLAVISFAFYLFK